MNDKEFDYSEVENLDYRKPNSEFDIGFEKLQQAAQNLADHKSGPEYAEKAEAYIREAYPLATLLRNNEDARQRLAMMAEQSKVAVRCHANNRDLLILFKVAQKRIGSATSASERNKWATVITYGVRHNLALDELFAKVNALNGITKASMHFGKLLKAEQQQGAEENETDDMPKVKVRLTVLDFNTEIVACIPAALANSISKRIAAAEQGGV